MAWFKRDKQSKKEETAGEQSIPAVASPHTGDSRSYRVVRGPHVTEKASNLSSLGIYVFRISPTANKTEVRRSIERLYKVQVSKVHILRMPAKLRQVGRHIGEKSGYKKAMVTLVPGQKIDVT